jgi:bifunctional DNA primase/polymerase-like protein
MSAPAVQNPLLDAALGYAALGWHVVPLYEPAANPIGCSCGRSTGPQKCASPAKHPRTVNGLDDSTTDETTIQQWWGMWPSANIGIRTGAVSGIVVVDIDSPEGEAALAPLLPSGLATPTQTTGKGRHLLFSHPGEMIQNRGRFRPGCDVKGDRGYIVAAPSRHASGHQYAWAEGRDPADLRLAPIPPTLLQALTSPRPSLVAYSVGSSDRPLQDDEIAIRVRAYMAKLPTGLRDGQGRNDVCFRLSCWLLHDMGLDGGVARPWVDEWNRENAEPLGESEILNTMRSAFKHGARPIGSGIDRPRAMSSHVSATHTQPPEEFGSPYRASPSGLSFHKRTQSGIDVVPLTNFTARVVADVIRDDGVEKSRLFEVEAVRAGRTSRFELPAAAFSAMAWVPEHLGAAAIVYPGTMTRDHTRVAIQELSGEPPVRHIYTHTGWREIAGAFVYLHEGGAIGATGLLTNASVDLGSALNRYELPEPPAGMALSRAIAASLRMLDVAPDHVTVPLLGSVYRAVLGPADFSGHLSGPTGVRKTALTALAQQHYGPSLDARHLPANWSSTANALEGQAFTIKDAMLIVDDFAPRGTIAEVQQLHAKADRLLRAQGNAAGRGRMRPDGSQRPTKHPRGLIVSTGEDLPTGESLRARLWIAELSHGDVNLATLTDCQVAADGGQYASALAAYLQWLAPHMAGMNANLRRDVAALRTAFTASGQHGRTLGIVADLATGWRYFLTFAVAAGAISPSDRMVLWNRCVGALTQLGEHQAEHQRAAEPAGRFLELLSAAIAGGSAHVASRSGGTPSRPAVWGWRTATPDRADPEWREQGLRCGWIDGDDLYLEPGVAHQVAQRTARDSGESLPVGTVTLRKRLYEKGYLQTIETHGNKRRLTIQRTIAGQDRAVLHLRADALSILRSAGSAGRAENGSWPAVPWADASFSAGTLIDTSSARRPEVPEVPGATAESPSAKSSCDNGLSESSSTTGTTGTSHSINGQPVAKSRGRIKVRV